MKIKCFVCLYVLLIVSNLIGQQTPFINITSPSSKRIVINSVSDYTHNIAINTNQTWKTRITNKQFDIQGQGAGDENLELTIRIPNFSDNVLIDTIFVFATNSTVEDYIIVEQMPLGNFFGVSYSDLVDETDYDGIQDWITFYGGEQIDDYYNFFPISSDRYVAAGWSSSQNIALSNTSSTDWIYNFLNSSLTVESSKTYGGGQYDINFFTAPTSSKGLVSCGFSYSNDGHFDMRYANNQRDIWVVNLDNEGNLLWKKHLGSNRNDIAQKVIETYDGGYVISGSTGNNSNDFNFLPFTNGTSIFATKLSNIGNIEWSYGINGPGQYFGKQVVPMRDGSMVLAGDVRGVAPGGLINRGGKDIWIGRISEFGDFMKDITFGGANDDSLSDVSVNYNDEILVISQSDSRDGDVNPNASQTNHNIYLQMTDKDLNTGKSKIVGGNNNEYIAKSLFSNDDGIILLYNSNSNTDKYSVNKGGSDIWLEKYDKDFNLVWDYHLGGNGDDLGHNIYLNENGGAYIAGHVNSLEFYANADSRGTRDGVAINVTEGFLSVLPKSGTLSNIDANDSIVFVVSARNSNFNIEINGNTSIVEVRNDRTANTNLNTIVVKRQARNVTLETIDIIFSVPDSDLEKNVKISVPAFDFMDLQPDTLYIEKEADAFGIVNMESNIEWRLNLSNESFFSINKTNGENSSQIVVTALQENTSRLYTEGILDATSIDGLLSDRTIVLQKHPDYFDFSPKKIDFEPYKNLQEAIVVETNLDWGNNFNNKFFSLSREQTGRNTYNLYVTTKLNNTFGFQNFTLPFTCSICRDQSAELTQKSIDIRYNTLLENNIRIHSNYKIPSGFEGILFDFISAPILKLDLSDVVDKKENVSFLPSGHYFFGIFDENRKKIKVSRVIKK